MYAPVKIILGSKSPRRLEILSDAGFEVEVVKPKIEERFPFDMNYYKVAEYLSKLKIFDIYSYLGQDDDFILCADTVVILDNKLIGKPKSLDQAFKFLKSLNGRSHDVVTGISIRKNKMQISFSELAKVHFKNLSDEEIKAYVNEFQPLDKAGAYNVQEFIGVEKVEGEFFNVMGLPLKRVQHEIKNWK
ncbi:MAG: septum formation protein Maf [Sphingobacteriales bacterium]|nr:septum formation protein Maf [Sphingobacteriales bacterium]